MPRNEMETEGLSLLGNKKTVYRDDYGLPLLFGTKELFRIV